MYGFRENCRSGVRLYNIHLILGHIRDSSSCSLCTSFGIWAMLLLLLFSFGVVVCLFVCLFLFFCFWFFGFLLLFFFSRQCFVVAPYFVFPGRSKNCIVIAVTEHKLPQ